MAKDTEIFESMIVSGAIGATLGALLTSGKSPLSALAGSVILASLAANEKARKSNVSFLIEENNVIYEITPDGAKRKVKELPHQLKQIPERFILK